MTRSDRSGLAGILAVMGGSIAALGSLMEWAQATGLGFRASARGLSGWEGKVTLLAAGLVLFAGLGVLAGSGVGRLRLPAAFGGLVITGVAVATALTARAQVIEGAARQISRRLNLPLEQTRDAVRGTFESGALRIGLATGLYLVVAGGILALGAAALAHRAVGRAALGSASGGGSLAGSGGRPGWPAPPPAGSSGRGPRPAGPQPAVGRVGPTVLPPPPPPRGPDGRLDPRGPMGGEP